MAMAMASLLVAAISCGNSKKGEAAATETATEECVEDSCKCGDKCCDSTKTACCDSTKCASCTECEKSE